MNSMSYTKYILGLAAKNVTEEIRNEFCSNMGNETVRVFLYVYLFLLEKFQKKMQKICLVMST